MDAEGRAGLHGVSDESVQSRFVGNERTTEKTESSWLRSFFWGKTVKERERTGTVDEVREAKRRRVLRISFVITFSTIVLGSVLFAVFQFLAPDGTLVRITVRGLNPPIAGTPTISVTLFDPQSVVVGKAFAAGAEQTARFASGVEVRLAKRLQPEDLLALATVVDVSNWSGSVPQLTVDITSADGMVEVPQSPRSVIRVNGVRQIQRDVLPDGSIGAAVLVFPKVARRGDQILWTVDLGGRSDPVVQFISVEMDMSRLGGSPIVTLRDDGKAGDLVAGDNLFIAFSVVPGNALVGEYAVPWIAQSQDGRQVAGVSYVTVRN